MPSQRRRVPSKMPWLPRASVINRLAKAAEGAEWAAGEIRTVTTTKRRKM